MNNFRILVADDHEIVRLGLVSLIESHPGWEVCAEADNGRMAVDKVKELKPDIAILDIGMPILNGLEATRQILRDNPQVKVLIMTVTDADSTIRAALDAGARGFVLKSDVARDVVAAVQALQYGHTFFTARASEMILAGYLGNARDEVTLPTLTSRERQVIQLTAEGKSTKEVACLLDVSTKTAETHRRNLMRKLNLHSVSELVLFALQNGVIQLAADAIQPSQQPVTNRVAA
jgi:DNA-binding NarL/FixJ family response regulator